MNQFEQPKSGEKEQSLKTAFETKEGERCFAKRVESAEDPQLEIFQKKLEENFSEKEVDSFETTQEAVREGSYLVHVAENSKGEVVGISSGAAVELVDKDGEASKKEAVLLSCYAFTDHKERGKGIGKQLQSMLEKDGELSAEERGLKVAGFMTEAHGGAEKSINSVGGKRCYIEKNGVMHEVPYGQGPLKWDEKTGKPAEGAGIFPEHLMLKLASGKNEIPTQKLMEMVRGMFYYNNYPDDGYFKNKKAENAHAKFMEGMEEELMDFMGKKKVRLLSAEERETMKGGGVKFVEHREKEDKEEARKEEKLYLDVAGERLEQALNKTGEFLGKGGEKLPQKQERAVEDAVFKAFDKLGDWIVGGGEKLPQKQERAVEDAVFKAFDKLGDWTAMGGVAAERGIRRGIKELMKIASEKGHKKAVEAAENEQKTREEKISFLQKAKNFGKEKLGKLAEGVSRLNLGEKLGVGLRKCKDLVIEGGKDLAAIGLTPFAALEKVGRDFYWRGQLDVFTEREIAANKKIETEKATPGYSENYLDYLKDQSRGAKQEYGRVLNMVYNKGRLLRILENLGGKLSKPISKGVERIPPLQ